MLSKKTKYGLKALTYLARVKGKEPVQIAEIAKQENISQKFLESILLTLRRNGFLGSKKGKGGGYYLLQNPEDINLADVMRLLDGPIAFLPCVTYKYYERCEECKDEETCGIRDIFHEVRNKTVELLKKANLAEIIKRESHLFTDSQ